MWTKTFWKDTTERAIKTAAQAALGVFSALTVATVQGGFDWAAWGVGLGVTVGASLVTSILSSLAGDKTSASLVGSALLAMFASTWAWACLIAVSAVIFAGGASAHETSGGPDYTTGGQALLNDHDCQEDEYKFIAASGNKVRCVPMDGGFPRLAPHE